MPAVVEDKPVVAAADYHIRLALGIVPYTSSASRCIAVL